MTEWKKVSEAANRWAVTG